MGDWGDGGRADARLSGITMRLRGRIVAMNLPRFMGLLHIIDENPGFRFEIVMDGVEFIDSAGIALLTVLKARAEAGGGSVRFHDVGARVRRFLERTGAVVPLAA